MAPVVPGVPNQVVSVTPVVQPTVPPVQSVGPQPPVSSTPTVGAVQPPAEPSQPPGDPPANPPSNNPLM